MPIPSGYNASAEPADDGFKPIPSGVYKTIITSAEVTTAKAGHEMVVLDYQVCDGRYSDTKSRFNYLSIGNPDSSVSSKAMGRYNAIFDACKKDRTGNTDDILNVPFNCTWKGKIGESGYPEYMHFVSSSEPTAAPPVQGAIKTPGAYGDVQFSEPIPERDIPF